VSTLPLVGPSSPLRSSVAEVRRIVNWEPIKIESGTGNGGAQAYLKQVAGYTLRQSLYSPIRALKTSQDRLFAIAGGSLFEIGQDWSTTIRGSVSDGATFVDDNETQLGIVSNGLGYAFDLTTNALTPITTNWPGSTSMNVVGGFGVLTPPDSNHFFITGLQDFTSLNPLDFASADTSPGNVVSALQTHRQLLLLKERTGEVWYVSDGDFPFARFDSADIEVGSAAAQSLCKAGGVAYWLGRDEDGSSVVFAMPGYVPQRVSSDALEEQLATLTADQIAGARAWTYHQEGQNRYVLNVPGLETTWVYNIAAGIWHERGEWLDGSWSQWAPTCHAFAFGKHVVGDDRGNLYELDPNSNEFGQGPLRRLWRSPHNAAPSQAVEQFRSFQVLCDVGLGIFDGVVPEGRAGTLLLRYSNDGGKTWGSWSELSLGAVGEMDTRVRDTALGSARDRVWEFVVTDRVRCNVISALVNEP